jgi:hypothetical protein
MYLNNQKVSTLCDELARIVDQARLSQDQFETLLYKLSPSERRLYGVLNEFEEIRAGEIRLLTSIANISQAANRINKKLESFGDDRRIKSRQLTVVNQYGLSEIDSFWFIELSGKH